MINGILNIYKERGYTSHDVVAVLRKVIGQKKIGHTGTLDPDAAGVLPVCLGRATKVCDMLTDKDKTYEAVLLLGRETDTQDISGKVLKEYSEEYMAEELSVERVKACIMSFIGEYDQIPPMYSALKINGKKLYELAREGKTVERRSRRVTICHIEIKEMDLPRVRMEVKCSKGTYIRTLCHDIGEKLGVGGCMAGLIRTQAGRFELRDSVKLSEVKEKMEQGRLGEILFPVDEVFSELPKAVIKDRYAAKAYNGNPFLRRHLLEYPDSGSQRQCRLYDEQGEFIAIYRADEDTEEFRLVKMFRVPE